MVLVAPAAAVDLLLSVVFGHSYSRSAGFHRNIPLLSDFASVAFVVATVEIAAVAAASVAAAAAGDGVGRKLDLRN